MDSNFGRFDLIPNPVSASTILSGIELADIQALMDENPSLRGYLQGYLAEMILRRKLLSVPGVEGIEKIPDRNEERGDLKIAYRNRPITMEVKSIATNSVRSDTMNETWQGTVLVKNTDRRLLEIDGLGEITSTNIIKGEFDILAICCFAVRGDWDFVFIESQYLPEPDTLPGLVKTKFSINPMLTAGLTHDPLKILEAVYKRKQ
jgi:hypothetical protein